MATKREAILQSCVEQKLEKAKIQIMAGEKPLVPGEFFIPKKKQQSMLTILRELVESEDCERLPKHFQEYLKAKGINSIAYALTLTKIEMALNSKLKPETRLRVIESIENRLYGKAVQSIDLNATSTSFNIDVKTQELFEAMPLEALKELHFKQKTIIDEMQHRYLSTTKEQFIYDNEVYFSSNQNEDSETPLSDFLIQKGANLNG